MTPGLNEIMDGLVLRNPDGAWWASVGLAVLALGVVGIRLTSLARARWASAARLGELVSPGPGAGRWARVLMVSLAGVLIGLAMARPSSGKESVESRREGRDIVFLVDVSRSMLVQDLAPNRLERAKLWMKDLVAAAQGDRIGVVAFAGAPVVRSPLTHDRDFVNLAIEELSPASAPLGGTLIGDAIRKTVGQVFGLDESSDDGLRSDDRARARDIILITDGDDQDSFPIEAAAAAGELGVRIIAIGVGDPDRGSPVPARENDRSRYQTYQGGVVRSTMNPETLTRIAGASNGGVFLGVGSGAIELDSVYADLIARSAGADQGAAMTTEYADRSAFFLIPALAVLLLELAWPARRRQP